MNLRASGKTLLWAALAVLFAVGAAACGRDSVSEDTDTGEMLSTSDITNPSVQVPELSSALIRDSFSGPTGQPLAGRQPETAVSTSSRWLTPGATDWRTDGESAILEVAVDRDLRAVIVADLPRSWVRASIVRERGLVGLVIRYSEETDWVMVWSNGSEMVAGQSVGGRYSDLGRQTFDWPASRNSRVFDLIDAGSEILVFVDGQEVLRFPVDPANVGNGVGLFTRNSDKNKFDDFTVWATPSDLVKIEASPASTEKPTVTVKIEASPTVTEKPTVSADDSPEEPILDITATDRGTIARGFELFGEMGCGSCHAVSGRDDATGGVAPGLDTIGDGALTRIPGVPASAYLRNSIIDPTAFIVDGYPAIMPSFEGKITPAELETLIAYLLSLSTGRAEPVTGVIDSFIGIGGRMVDEGRVPEHGPAETVWVAKTGNWSLGPSGMIEAGGANADSRLIVESGIDRASTSVNLRWSDGIAGLVARYTDSRNWIMVWYDQSAGIVISAHSSEGFEEIQRIKYDWGAPGTGRRMKIDDFGDIVDVWVDEDLIYSFSPGPVPPGSIGGLFSRGHTANEFSRFAIIELGDRPVGLLAKEDDGFQDDGGPQVVLPPDPMQAPRFIEEWRDRRGEPQLSGSFADAGYTIEVVADEGIAHPISITFGDGVMYVASGELAALDKGAVYALEQMPDGEFGPPVLVATGLRRPTGILYAFGYVYVSSRGAITRLRDLDGDLVADEAEEIVTGLPFGREGVEGHATDHQTHGLRLGPDGRIYVTQGARTDRGPLELPLEGTIFSMLADGSDIKVYATGFRNAFDFDFNSRGDMFTADNGPNVLGDSKPPDELHYVRPGGDHGFPDVFGDPPAGSDVEKPLRKWFTPIAPGGMEFYDGGTLTGLSNDDLLLVMWNKLAVIRLRIEMIDGVYAFIEEELVMWAFGTPITDLTVAPDGNIYVADWGGGRIFRVRP